ncbi:MAG: hypothetical protein WC314_27960 [Vulcanimicrobiota bacterium]
MAELSPNEPSERLTFKADPARPGLAGYFLFIFLGGGYLGWGVGDFLGPYMPVGGQGLLLASLLGGGIGTVATLSKTPTVIDSSGIRRWLFSVWPTQS